MNLNSFLKSIKNITFSPTYFLKEYSQFYAHQYLLNPPDYSKYKFLDGKETLEYLLKNKKSFIRLGEGEFSLLYGLDTIAYSQKYYSCLKDSLIKIIKDYNPNSPYFLAVPRLPIEKLTYSGIRKKKKIAYWHKAEAFMRNRLREDCLYGDPLIFKRVLNKDIESFKLWGNKSVLLVGSMVKYFKNKQLELTKKQYLIEAPATDAFREYQNILKDILRVANFRNLKRHDLVILICLGVATKPIIYELSRLGLIAYDMGTYFDSRHEKKLKCF